MQEEALERVVVCGGPHVGKTTFAIQYAMEHNIERVHMLDSLIGRVGWSEHSELASRLFDSYGSWVVEGVQAARALDKWLKQNDEGKPCDKVILLNRNVKLPKFGQRRMRTAVHNKLEKIREELIKRGVEIEVIT